MDHLDTAEPLPSLLEDREDANSPPQATLARRAKSYSDFYDIVTARLPKPGPKKKRRKRPGGCAWEGLDLPALPADLDLAAEEDDGDGDQERDLLLASQQEYLYAKPLLVVFPSLSR